MVYTLLGTPTLGFDLVRIQQGRRVAEIVLTALHLTPEDLPKVAGGHPGSSRRMRWNEAVTAASSRSLNAVGALDGHPRSDRTIDLEAAKEARVRVLLQQLESSRLGDLDALDRLVRSEILDWTWHTSRQAAGESCPLAAQGFVAGLATDVLVDAIAAAYAAEVLPDGLARRLSEPFTNCGIGVRVDPLEGTPEQTAAVLGQLAALTAGQRHNLRGTVDRLRSQSAKWAPAMHDASWAIHLSGRARVAAAAQLVGTMAFADAGFTGKDGAYGVWNAVAGVIAASVVADLLPEDSAAILRAPWDAAGIAET
ncbi:MAG: hypothetical protein CSA58_08720 [Micrococcales bacterium]|nr:MAG: hypothetical protein CSA58_08720 [Micrococcales bacterium]